MNTRVINREPQTLAERNLLRLTNEIISGKEFRRERRRKKKKTYLRFGNEKIAVYK